MPTSDKSLALMVGFAEEWSGSFTTTVEKLSDIPTFPTVPEAHLADKNSIPIKAFHACKQEDRQSVSTYILNMKGYLDTLECLGYDMPKELGVGLILNSLNKDYNQFVQNYNVHSIGKSIVELHAMLKLHKKGISKKAKTPVVLAIREGKIHKDKKKPQRAKGKDKGKNKLAYAPKPKTPPPPKRDNSAKDSVYHHCKEVGYWKRNCSSYQDELKKRKNASIASTLGQDCNFTQQRLEESFTDYGDNVRISCDAIWTSKRQHQNIADLKKP
nr:zinc finger, CCHC-type [Tanacetum cinerariifolium]